jgi:hypothetical protein
MQLLPNPEIENPDEKVDDRFRQIWFDYCLNELLKFLY